MFVESRSRMIIVVALMQMLGSIVLGCKPAPSPSSATKDFALSAKALNFAVLAGDDQDDLRNYNELLRNEHLGSFKVSGGPGTTVEQLANLLREIGENIRADSTLVIAYSGSKPLDGNLIRVALGGLISEANARQISKSGRLYIFNDSPDASSINRSMIRGFAQLSGKQGLFQQVMELSGPYKEVTGKNHAGRLAYSFAKAFEEARNDFSRQHTNPTLGSFFSNVRTMMGGNLTDMSVAIEPQDGKEAILNETLFAPETFATRTARHAPGNYKSPSTGIPNNLDLPLEGQAASLGLLFRPEYSHLLVEVSSAWCGPCAAAAISLAKFEPLQAKLATGRCGMATIIVDDGDNATNKLEEWFNYLSRDQGSTSVDLKTGKSALQVAKDHSYKTPATGKQLNGDQAGGVGDPRYFDFLRKRFGLKTLAGEDMQLPSYPSFFVVDRAGQVVAMKRPDEATLDFANLMIELCN